MKETKWKQVTAAECLKWLKAHPMKEAVVVWESFMVAVRQRWNPETECLECNLTTDEHSWDHDICSEPSDYYSVPVEDN